MGTRSGGGEGEESREKETNVNAEVRLVAELALAALVQAGDKLRGSLLLSLGLSHRGHQALSRRLGGRGRGWLRSAVRHVHVLVHEVARAEAIVAAGVRAANHLVARVGLDVLGNGENMHREDQGGGGRR